ncbi:MULTISPECIES: hypothetical protein [Sphingobacterium]|uniref:hypothetical protein n=1 Tax=Sphingobacterium TaxID=28453 RepID=UPI0013D9B113|nr:MULTISPECIES: hypothetical protein [unclassified Sphingobacterium]
MQLHAIITGDIVDSRSKDVKEWMPILESTLTECSEKFDIFRGDSFQLMVDLEQAIRSLFYIKSRMKTISQLDVRMGLGIGTVDYMDNHIKNSWGQAFVRSGEVFESLHKELIAVSSPWPDWDEATNIILGLCVEIANKWTVNMAETVAESLRQPNANQQELAKVLQRKHQSQISTELTKANWNKINKAIIYSTEQLLKKC